MQLVVVNAVAAAVMAATITFNSTSQNRLFFINSYILHLTSYILKMLGPQPQTSTGHGNWMVIER